MKRALTPLCLKDQLFPQDVDPLMPYRNYMKIELNKERIIKRKNSAKETIF